MKWFNLCINPSKQINKLYEESVKQLKVNTWNRAKRVKEQSLKIAYKGVDKKGVIHFSCTSGTIKGKFYKVTIALKDFNDAKGLVIDGQPISNKEILQLSMSGDIEVHCTCPDFKYRFSYLAYTRGYGILKETRYPKIRNRNLQGTTCKHIQAVLNGLPFHFSSVQSDYIKRGLLLKPLKKTKKKKG